MLDAQFFAHIVKKQITATCSTCDRDDFTLGTVQFLLHFVEDRLSCFVPDGIGKAWRGSTRRVNHVSGKQNDPGWWLRRLLGWRGGREYFERLVGAVDQYTQLPEQIQLRSRR